MEVLDDPPSLVVELGTGTGKAGTGETGTVSTDTDGASCRDYRDSHNPMQHVSLHERFLSVLLLAPAGVDVPRERVCV